ncbi:hypothetical protein FOA52_000058 [Chlamydomonas sp. UWO 241]|nr:hypothetical protein FOA52_000058 [Chlamydomonas sp. UWO 241]
MSSPSRAAAFVTPTKLDGMYGDELDSVTKGSPYTAPAPSQAPRSFAAAPASAPHTTRTVTATMQNSPAEASTTTGHAALRARWADLSDNMRGNSRASAELLVQQAATTSQAEAMVSDMLALLQAAKDDRARLEAQVWSDRANFTAQAKLLSQHFSAAHTRTAALQAASQSQQAELHAVHGQLGATSEENERLKEHLAALQAELLHETSTREDADTALKEHGAALREMTKELEHARTTCTELHESKGQLKAQMRSMVRQERELTDNLKTTHSQIDEQLALLRGQLSGERAKRMQANRRKGELLQTVEMLRQQVEMYKEELVTLVLEEQRLELGEQGRARASALKQQVLSKLRPGPTARMALARRSTRAAIKVALPPPSAAPASTSTSMGAGAGGARHYYSGASPGVGASAAGAHPRADPAGTPAGGRRATPAGTPASASAASRGTPAGASAARGGTPAGHRPSPAGTPRGASAARDGTPWGTSADGIGIGAAGVSRPPTVSPSPSPAAAPGAAVATALAALIASSPASSSSHQRPGAGAAGGGARAAGYTAAFAPPSSAAVRAAARSAFAIRGQRDHQLAAGDVDGGGGGGGDHHHASGDGMGATMAEGRRTLGDVTNKQVQPPARTFGTNLKTTALTGSSKPAAPHYASAFQTNTFASDPSRIDGLRYGDAGRRDWVDIDKLNEFDPQACAAYAQSICQYLREAELNKRANPRYLEDVQNDVNAKMRAILVDWLVEVAEEYKLCADTLYQAVNYIDRFMSLQTVPRNQLQLVGVTCMWVAAKYEEIYPPNVSDFCYITDNTYPKEQLVHMEEVILKRLDYELTVPTAKTFLRRLLQVCNPDELLHFLSNYLTELALLDYSMLNFVPSVTAAAGVYLANLMLKRQPWDANLRHYSTYIPPDISSCAIALSRVHASIDMSPNLAAIREKYAHPRFQSVSTMAPISAALFMFA